MKILSACLLTSFAPFAPCGLALDNVAQLVTHYVAPVVFIVAVLIIALTIWLIRSLVESNPEPLYLNLTFFAFAGQCIRIGELISEGPLSRFQMIFQTLLFILGLFFVVSQVLVMKAHMRVTREYYQELLAKHKADDASRGEIDHWANALLRISGVDFHPESSRRLEWLYEIFRTETRAKTRMDAFDSLPESLFQVKPPFPEGKDPFTPESLIVPVAKRTRLWNCYVGLCGLTWTVFVAALLASAKYP